MEKEIEVEAYGVIQICEVCKKGEMFPTGNNSYTPIKLEHKCSSCGNKKYYNVKYPLINYRLKRID